MSAMNKHKTRGFTIVEIMIALLLSAILLGGVVQVYSSSKQSYRVTENIARMQENSRFAMNYLTREIRMAGFTPCPVTIQVANVLTGGASNATNFNNGALVGFEGGTSTFPSEFPAAGTTAGDRVADSDGFILMRGGDNSYTLGTPPHNASSAQFKIIDATGIFDGDILMVCDNKNTAIFQADNVTIPTSGADSTLVHNAGGGGISPGNCTKALGWPVDCPAGITTSYTYDTDAQIVKFISTAYYIGVSQSGNGRALYRRNLVNNTGGTLGLAAPQELIDGIESMQVLYGLDDPSNNDNLADRYVTADQVGAANWNNIVSVRVALLTYTPDQVDTQNDSKTYYLAGTQFGTASHGADKRMRQVYTSTIKIRNRGQI